MLYTNNNTSLLGKLSSTSTTRKKKKHHSEKSFLKKIWILEGKIKTMDCMMDTFFFFHKITTEKSTDTRNKNLKDYILVLESWTTYHEISSPFWKRFFALASHSSVLPYDKESRKRSQTKKVIWWQQFCIFLNLQMNTQLAQSVEHETLNLQKHPNHVSSSSLLS